MKTKYNFVILASIIAIMNLLSAGFVNSQDWFDTDWEYRSTLNITNTGASTLTDFQVLVDLDSSFDFAKANSDGSDLRITDANGISLIPFWIESWDDTGQEASIWVKVPSVPTSGTTIYMYYGNTLAENASDGYSTFLFFDDFSEKQGNWIRYLTWTGSGWSGYAAHYWKYSSIMQEGAINYAIAREANSWTTESLDEEIEMEFDYLHGNVNTNGTINGLSSSSQYEYGVILSGLALGYLYFDNIDAILAQRCYDDMFKVYGYVKSQWTTPSSANDCSMTLRGYANAWKAFDAYGNSTSATEVQTIIVNYVSTFITNQGTNGYWNTGSAGVQTQLKRNFAVLFAYDVTGTSSYLDAVKDNIDWILANRWISANGGLTWSSSSPDEFYECHQMWFMVASRMLYNRSGGTYDYLTESQQAWYFLTDNNYAGIDMYVHNYDNYNAFFSYREVKPNGTYQTTNNWKGSYEMGVTLWGMSQNYSWVSNYQSSHSSQAYNYLDEVANQCKQTPANNGFLGENAAAVNSSRWTVVGGPSVSIVEDNGNQVVSLKSSTTHNSLITTIDNSFDDFVFETKVKMTADGNSLCNPEIDFRYTDNNNRYLTILRGETINDLYFRRYQGGSTFINTGYSFNYTANIYYNYKIIADGDEIKLYLDDYLLTNYTDAGTGILTGGFSLHNYRNNYAAYYDDVRVRSFASPEPTAALGTEQYLTTTWTGTVDTDWSDAENWIADAPESYSKVTIPSAPVNQPHIMAAPASPAQCDDLTIESGALVTVEAGKALTVSGNIVNNAGNSGLVILSDASGTGSLIESNGVNASVDRFLTEDQWHYITAPVDDPLAEVFLGMYMMCWDEPTGEWTYIYDPNYVMSNDMEGYAIWTVDDATVTFTGNLNTGAKSFSTTNTFGALHNNKGFNLCGNPYPSSLNWNVDEGDGWTRTSGNTDPTLYIWNHAAGNYGVYVKDNPIGTNSVDSIIPPHQGFVVHCSAATGYIGVDNGARIHAAKDILKQGAAFDDPILKLKVEGNSYTDEILFRIDPKATLHYDDLYDALKYHGDEESPQLYSLSKDNRELSINAFPDTKEYNVIPLGLEVGQEAIYSISVSELNGFELANSILLEDLKTGVITKIESNSSYSFTANPIDDPIRFLLHLDGQLDIFEYSKKQTNIYSMNKVLYVEVPENTKGNIVVTNILGQEIFNTPIGDVLTKISLDMSAYYIVTVFSDEGVEAKKVFIK